MTGACRPNNILPPSPNPGDEEGAEEEEEEDSDGSSNEGGLVEFLLLKEREIARKKLI